MKKPIRKKEEKLESPEDEDPDLPEEQPHERDKRLRSNLLVFGILLAVLSFVGIILYLYLIQGSIFSGVTEQYSYNQYDFVRVKGLWTTQVQIGGKLISIPMHYGPREVEHISILGSLNESFDQGSIYITFDPTDSNMSRIALSAAELSINVAQGINRPIIAACSKNITEICNARPIVDCSNKSLAVIYLNEDIQSRVIFDQNCITISGTGDDMVKAVDRLLLYWYRIMR